MFNDGLVKLELAKNFYFNRNLKANSQAKLNNKLIQDLIKNRKLILYYWFMESQFLKTDGKTYLLTYAKFYNKKWKLRKYYL